MKVTPLLLLRLLTDETAAGAIEYVLLASLIALAAIVALRNFDKKLVKDYNKLTKKF